MIHWPESIVESDSSHSGIVTGVKRWPRVGLAGQDAAKKGNFKEADCLAIDSQLKFCIEILVIGGESGGVTGALFEILRGRRDEL